nr:plectin isoform X2 [Misgurnus anguillicaudatus]
MVAGMVMPLDNLRAIYERLFRDGVMVAKKDKRPQIKHPEIPGVDNLHVIRAMGSLKSRAYVRETFAWRHFYWYLTNPGIIYLRDYLHLPSEIVPTPLQRVRRPAATLPIAPKGARVQTVQGPTSYVPKPGRMGTETQEAVLDRQEYRRKMMSTDEAEMMESNEKTPRFRGRPIGSSQIKPKESWEPRDQPMLSQSHTKEMEPSVRRKAALHTISNMPPFESQHVKPVKQERMMDMELRECTKTALIQKTQKVDLRSDVPTVSSTVEVIKEKNIEEMFTSTSQTAKEAARPGSLKQKVEKIQKTVVTKNVQGVPTVSTKAEAITMESSMSFVPTEAVKEKAKEEVAVKIPQQTTFTGDAPHPTPSKPKMEKTQKTVLTETISSSSGSIAAQSSMSHIPTEAVKDKSKEDVYINVSQKTTSTVTSDSKTTKDAPHSAASKLKVEKTQKMAVNKNMKSNVSSSAESITVKSEEKPKEVSNVLSTAASVTVKSSMFSELTEVDKEKPKEEVAFKVSQKTTSTETCDSKTTASLSASSKPKVEKKQKTVVTEIVKDVAVSSSTKSITVESSMSSVSTKAEKEKPKEEMAIKVSQKTTTTGDSKIDVDAPQPISSKSKAKKTQKTVVTEIMKDVSNVSSEARPVTVKSSMFSDRTEADKEKPKEEVVENVVKTQKTIVTEMIKDMPVSSSFKSITVESSMSSVPTKAEKEKPNEEMAIKVSQKTTSTGDSKIDMDAPQPISSKSKVKKTQKTVVTEIIKDVSVSSSSTSITIESSMSSVSTEAEKEKSKDVAIKVSQETSSKDDSKKSMDAPHPAPLKQKEKKTRKTVVTEIIRDVSNVSSEAEPVTVKSSVFSELTEADKEKPKEEVVEKAVKTQKTVVTEMIKDMPVSSSSKSITVESSMSSVPTEAEKENPKEEMAIKVSQKTTTTGDSKIDMDAPQPISSKSKVKKTQKTVVTEIIKDVLVSSTSESTTIESSKSSVSTEAEKEKNKEDVAIKVSQETTSTGDSKTATDAPLKPKMKKTQKTVVTEMIKDVSNVSSEAEPVTVKSSVFSELTEADNKKPKEEVLKAEKTDVTDIVKDVSNVSSVPESVTVKSSKSSVNTKAEKPSEEVVKVEKTQKKVVTEIVKDVAVFSSSETITVESSMSSVPIKADKENTKDIKVSQKTTSKVTGDNITNIDAPQPISSKPKVEKKQKAVEEQPLTNANAAITIDTSVAPNHGPAVCVSELKTNNSVTTQIPDKPAESEMQSVFKNRADFTMDTAEAKSEINLSQKTEKVEIEAKAISTTEVMSPVKSHKADSSPVSQSPSTASDAELNFSLTDTSKTSEVTQQTAMKLESTTATPRVRDSSQQKSSTGEPVAAEEAKSKPSKGKKKKQKSADKTPPEVEAKATTAQDSGKVDPAKVEDPEQVVTNDSAKTSSEGMHTVECMQSKAVQSEAPVHKREVELAQPSAEKREAPKEKTSSTKRQREAPAASAAAVSAQSNPLPDHREPPSVAQHSAAPETQQSKERQNRLSDSKAPPQPVNVGHPFSVELTCDAQKQPVDEAMRKKIVVVEEVVEVQQIASPGSDQPVAPPLQEIPGDDLDYDVLEELAIERGILKSPDKETFWDHSLQEPEQKTFPNFIEDERDRVQKKTFTKWVNKHLIKHWKSETQRHVNDLYEDLRDGHNLISLLEVLSGETLPRERGRMRFHKLQNVQIALDFLKHRQVKLVNIRNDDIADGNPKLTLGLIWTIILHFQVSHSISDIQVNGQSDDMSAKEKLLLWSQRMSDGYQGIHCQNFTTSWRDGKLFNAVIHKHEPRLIDMTKVYRQTNLENLEQAFSVAEQKLGVTRLLDPEDVDVPHPDEKSIITYVSSLYDAMPRVPDVRDGGKTNELELRWQEYYELVTIILQWIRHHVVIFEERKFPASYEEIEILWRQFLKFKETELPGKESDKIRSKLLYQSFESAVHAGQIKVPPGYHPIDVEKEWGRLHVAILERERLLRIEFERLERLQQIVTKVQMESGVCEEQLNQMESLMQTDIRLLNAGKPAKSTAEMERDLDKADGMIRLLFNDVQLLKDGRHLQAEQVYRRVYRLHERLVNMRSDYNLRFKTQRVRPEVDEVTLRYAQDLLAWVEENQRRIETAEWGIDLPSVESQLGSHRGLHQTVEDFRAKIERARTDENQLSPASKDTYREYLGKLDLQYNKLLNSSKFRLRNLDQLYTFVSAATKELMWLNDKEEEEVNYDWSDRNTNMTAKKENYSGLMRELELREKKISDIQATGERFIRDGHPGKKTIEAFTAALQTQWSWILQLCCCIETHLRENTAYFQFFADVKESEEKMKKMQETMKKKYLCDRITTATRLEDLLQDAVEEREQLNEFKNNIANLNKRAKTIVQLKPRDPTTPFKGKLPIQSVCDFKQMEITIHKGDECALINNSQPSKWKVLNRSGDEAIVPSVCFLVPPVNKEAVESVSRLETGHQQILIMWQKLHVDMRTLLSWQYLIKDIQLIRSWNITMFKTMKPDEYQLILRNLQLHYQDFLKESKDSNIFDSSEQMQIERDYKDSAQHFDHLLRTLEKGEQDESVCKTYINQIRSLRMQIEDCDSRTVARIRQPLDKDPLRDCIQKTAEQTKVHAELEGIKKNLNNVAKKAEEVLISPEQSSTPVLRSELDITLQKMDQTYSLSSVYLEKLKTIELVIQNTQGAEDVVKKYENRLRDVHTVPTNIQEVDNYCTELKKMRMDAEAQQPVLDGMEGELSKAKAVSHRMVQVHSERDTELDHYRQLQGSLQERWRAIFAQIDLRQRELELLGRQQGYYRESYDWLIRWIADAKQRQEKIQAVPIFDSKTLKEQLANEKKLLEEIEKNKEKVDECQKYAKAYIDTIKDYELQLVAYKAQVEPILSPVKKTKMESASDNIIQEYVTLRTRYSELMTLTSQYIKFITDSQRRLEDDEKAAEKLKEEERKKMAEMQAELEKQKQLAEAHAKAIAKAEQEANELKLMMQQEVSRREIVAVDAERQKHNIQQELHELKNLSEQQIKSKSQQVEDALSSRTKIEEEIRIIRLQLETTVKQKSTAEDELKQLREKAAEAERLRKAAQEEAEKLRKQVTEETQKKRLAEEELKQKLDAEKEAARQKQKALDDLEKLKMQAEEAMRNMKQAEIEKDRQMKIAQEAAQKTAAAELDSKRMSFVEKTSKLEESLREKHGTVVQLQEEAERLRKQQEEADKAREEAEKELEKWRQKANEALRLRLQAEEEAHKKSLAQEDAEKQKEDAEREAKKRAKAEESALKQKEMAEQELERQRKLAESTAQQKLSAEHELIRLRADFEHAEKQRTLLDDELYRLKNEVVAAEQQRKQLVDELSKTKSEMEILLELKAKAEKESMSTTEKSKQLLEAEAAKLRDLADEASKLRAIAEEAKRQRQVAEEEANRQRAEAERILKEKLATINEATRLKTEAEIALKEKEAENERLRRNAEEEAYQRKALEDQAGQHKQDIEQKIDQLKKSSEAELDRQKTIVDETLKQKRIVEEEIRILKLNFEKASSGKLDLELELNKLKNIAEETQVSKLRAEEEAEKLRKLALVEENRRREAEEKLKKITAAEQEAARQRQAAQEEVERLKKKAEEARKQKEDADKEAERQIFAAKEAAEKAISAEQQVQSVLYQQKEDSLVQKKLKEEFEKAKKLAQEAEKAKEKAEREAALLRQKAEDAELQRQAAEVEAAHQANAQEETERLRKEAELEAEKRAQAEAAALRQKQLADEEMARHKKLAEQTLKQKSQVEQELAKVKLRLDETDKQKTLLDDELHRLKDEVSDAVKQKAQVEDELFKVKIQMEELIKLKLRIEEENQRLIQKDKDNTQKFLAEEAENMKKLAEEAARLSVESQEAARMRHIAETDLAEQRALAEKMLKEKMQAIQEASKLRAEAEMLQRQKDLAQEQAQKLLEDKQLMQQKLEEETEGFQKSLEAERKRQLEILAEAEKLKLQVSQLSDAQSRAEDEARKFKKQANEISARLHETELATREKMTVVGQLEVARLSSDREADDLRKAIADLENEREKLKKEAEELQKRSKEMANAQQEQIKQEKTILQQTFMSEKEMLLKKEKQIEDEKKKLENQFEEEVKKSKALKDEQERQRKQMEDEKMKLKATMDAALKKQKEAEQEMLRKQKEMQELERIKLQQERMLAEENQQLREKLLQLEVVQKVTQETERTVPNGQSICEEVDSFPALSFDGIREKVPASRLFEIGLISKTDYDKLQKGETTVQELSKTDKLKTILKGKDCISGLLVHPNQKMSIYQAIKEKKIAPGTGLVLLEAQAASGYIIDPLRNKKLSVNEAVKEGLIGPELHNKMLSAERAVTGYKDPYTEAKISLFEAMKKGLIGEEHAIRLLEAQIASGGIIDPVNSHRVPIEIAYKQGQLDAATNNILQNPSDDLKGFYDPNTQENTTYQKLMERCVTDPETGLLLLPISEEAALNARTFTDEETKDVFDKTTVSIPFGRFKGKTVTIWEIINSEYFTEDQKKDLIRQYKTGKITVEKIIKIVLTVAEEKEKKNELTFDGLRAPVPATKLLESKIIDKDIYNKLQRGQLSVKEVSEMENVHKALKGTNCIAGVIIDSTKQVMSFYDAMKMDMMRPEPALNLLEAQAATGYIVNPIKNQNLTVDEAVKAGVVGPELHEKLLSAERAVTGYKDPYTGKTISLFEAMKKYLIMKDRGIRLLDAQLATGGIIDPVQSHRIPQDIACIRGCFDDETHKSLTSLTDDVKGYFDPNTQEYVTYLQLYKRCVTDKKTGLQLLPLSEQAINAKEELKYTEAQTKDAMTQSTVEVQSGPFKGRRVTIWELINSNYLTEEQRLDLMRQYRSGKITIEKITRIFIEIINVKENKNQENECFKGLRAPVPSKSLFDSKIIDKSTYDLLEQGKTTPNEVSKNNSVNKYLQGSESIAGVYLEPTKEKVSIYQAMRKKFLRQNTGISLLEAQAATGFMVDPSRNEFLTVDDAVKAGLVGPELHEKLLSAEKAVTGYKDPFTGNKISLHQAMEKDLILKEHAMPLLEAQLSTGGIIDPVNSHRVPVDVAIQKGYFSKQLASSITESRYFSDPATDENISYKVLKDKCMTDPDTGLNLIKLSKPQAPTVVEKTYLYSEEQTQSDLSTTQIDIPVEGQGSMSLWDVMNSNLLPEEQRNQLLEDYRSGNITKERMIIIIIEILEQTEIVKGGGIQTYSTRRRQITIEDLYNARIIDLETYNLLKIERKTMRDVMEIQSVKKYLYGTGSVAGVVIDLNTKISIYEAMKRGLIKPDIALSLLEAQASTGFIIDPIRNDMLTVDEAVRKGLVGPEIHDKLLSAERAVTGYKDPYSGKVISLFQAMKKGLVPEDYALRLLEAQAATGGIIDPELNFHLPTDIATQRGYINKETTEKLSEEFKGYVDPLTEEKISYAQLIKRCKVDKIGLYLLSLSERRLLFKGIRKDITIEELLLSRVITEETVTQLNEGLLTVEELSSKLRNYLEGSSSIAGVFVESTKDRLSVYQAMKKNMIRPGTAFELLEAQAATGYIIDPIKNLKLTVNESIKMGIVGPEFKDKLLSAERAVTGYRDPYTGKTISLFQAMKKGLILRDHGIRLLEAQIATGGIIDPEQSHRLPVEVAYNRGFFDEEMNDILSDPSDDTKGFFDPNTEENLTYLQLMERCIVEPDTGLVLLLLKEKKREGKTSSKSSVRKRRVVIVDPDSGKEMSVYEAYRKGLIDHQTYLELSEQECEWEEITMTSSDGVEKSILIDRRSGRQYDIEDAIARGLIDHTAIDQYRSGTLSITEFADMLSGNIGGLRSRSSSFGSTSSYPMSPVPSIKTPTAIWNDPTEETGPVAGILDTDSLEKVSITEAMHRNLVDSITGQRLLEAQACTGGLIDPSTGEKFTVTEATEKGLVDKIMVDRLNLAQKAFNGFEDPRTKVKMSAAQALKKGWLYYEAGQRFLEVQYLTGGLIEPDGTGRMSLEEAIRKGSIDVRTAQKLRDVSSYSKYITCPKTKLKISYKDAMDRSMVEEGSGLRLLEASSTSSKGLYSPYNVSGAASASGSRSGSRTGSRRGSFDATGSGLTMNFSSSSYTSTSYNRRF